MEDAYKKNHRPGWPGEPTFEGYKKGIQQGLYPEQRWIEPRDHYKRTTLRCLG